MHKKMENDQPTFKQPVMEALSEILSLKMLFRQGWIQQGVQKEFCESVADHSFSTAMMGWILAREYFPELDENKVLQMAMVHELGEIYAGDITPRDNVPLDSKHQMEEASIHRVMDKLPVSAELIALWEEFEEGSSPEAVFIRQIDKLEMAFQAVHYEKATNLDLQIFLDYTDKVITDEKLKSLFHEMCR